MRMKHTWYLLWTPAIWIGVPVTLGVMGFPAVPQGYVLVLMLLSGFVPLVLIVRASLRDDAERREKSSTSDAGGASP